MENQSFKDIEMERRSIVGYGASSLGRYQISSGFYDDVRIDRIGPKPAAAWIGNDQSGQETLFLSGPNYVGVIPENAQKVPEGRKWAVLSVNGASGDPNLERKISFY